jgi:hypothetical protein
MYEIIIDSGDFTITPEPMLNLKSIYIILHKRNIIIYYLSAVLILIFIYK